MKYIHVINFKYVSKMEKKTAPPTSLPVKCDQINPFGGVCYSKKGNWKAALFADRCALSAVLSVIMLPTTVQPV